MWLPPVIDVGPHRSIMHGYMAPLPSCTPHLIPMHDGVEHPQRLVSGAVRIELGNDDRVSDDERLAQALLQPEGCMEEWGQ